MTETDPPPPKRKGLDHTSNRDLSKQHTQTLSTYQAPNETDSKLGKQDAAGQRRRADNAQPQPSPHAGADRRALPPRIKASSDRAEFLAATILRRHIYIDSAKLYVEREPTPAEVKQLKTLAGSVHIGPPMPRQPWWRACIWLHQPKPEALILIRSAFRGILISRVDIALDLMTSHQFEAHDLRQYLEQHLVQRWRGTKKIKKYKDTTYFGAASSANNLVLYSDKTSRHYEGANCCHIEWRVTAAKAIKAAGVKHLTDLMNLDLAGFLARRLLIRAIPSTRPELQRLGHAILHRPKQQNPMWQSRGKAPARNIGAHTGFCHLRASIEEVDQINAQQALDFVGNSFIGHFPELNSSWLLPESPEGKLYD